MYCSAYFVPPAFENIVWRTYIIFGVFCFASTIHVFLAFPETAGKTLEEIDAVFEPGVKAWKTGNMKSNFSEKVAAVQSKGLDANELVHSESAVVDEKGAVVKSDTVV